MIEAKQLKNKSDQYEYLQEVNSEIVKLADDAGNLKLADVSAVMKVVLESFKPQQGGGVSKNPPKDINGVTYYYCRHLEDYMPESEMIMSLGKSKGASIYANKYFFKLEKDVSALQAKVVELSIAGDFEQCAQVGAQAKAIEASRHIPETYKSEEFEEFKAELIRIEEEKKAEKAKLEEEKNTQEGDK